MEGIISKTKAELEGSLYVYKANIVSVYDGDTVRADIDLGFNSWIKNQPIRLYGINTPELRGVAPEVKAKAIEARDFLSSLVMGELKTVLLETIKDKTGKYGRWLGIIWFQKDELVRIDYNYYSANDMLLQKGLAEVMSE